MHNDSNYLHRILAFSEKHNVQTSRPVHGSNGIKLLDPGVHLSAALYDKLVLHKLAVPIDECLASDSTVTADMLESDLNRLVLSQPDFSCFSQTKDALRSALVYFSTFPLGPLAAFKLTVMRQQMPETYQHSLEVAYCALVLAMNLEGFDEHKQKLALASGLFHDIGLLHVDPEVLKHDGPLRETQRQQIYAHPITGHLIVGRLQEWPAQIGRAVLEHHERLDASGYPRGICGNEISPLGQLLGLAELAASIFSRQRAAGLSERIHVILRLNQGKFNKTMADVLVKLALTIPEDPSNNKSYYRHSYSEILDWLVGLSMNIQEWHAITAESGQLPIVELISNRIEQLEHNLASLGVDVRNWGMIDGELQEDKEALQELSICILEGKWQLNAIAQEITRKWDKICPQHQILQKRIWDWVNRINAS